MLDVFVVMLDSTSDILPTASVPATVALLLNVVALATVPPVKVVPAPTAEPFQVNVPLSFVSATPSRYKSPATAKALSTETVP